jgi:hypothetical protein
MWNSWKGKKYRPKPLKGVKGKCINVKRLFENVEQAFEY